MCENLKSVTLPNLVESVGEGAFRGCKGWRLRVSGMRSANEDCYSMECRDNGILSFIDCDPLMSIEVAEGNEHFTVVDGMAFDKEMKPSYPTALAPGANTKSGYSHFYQWQRV